MEAPAEPSDEPGLHPRALVAILAAALLVRLIALAQLAGSPWNEVLLGDARHFDEWGRRVADGEWLGYEVFYQAPLYPYFLGAVYAVLGHTLLGVRLIQVALGALAAVAIAAGTRRLASARAGLVAGALAALYAPAIWYDLQIEKTSLAFSLTAFLFYSIARAGARLSTALGAGLLLGALTLLRENAAVLIAPLAWACGRERAGRGRSLAALLAGFGLLLLPVGIRNRAVGGSFLPTASNAGVNFYIGNGAEADGQYRPLVAGRGHPDYEREDATRIAERLAGRELSPAAVSRFWFAQAGREIAQAPGHFLRLLGHKLRLLLHHAEIMDAVAFEAFQDDSSLLHVLSVFSFGLLLPLCLAGAVLARGRPGAGESLLALLLLALSIVAFFVVGRFRLGLVPFAIPFAAVALAGWPGRRAALHAGGLLVAGALLAWWPLELPGDPRATSASNLASELLRRGEFALAERWAQAAWERDPSSAEAAYNLGVALRRQEKHAEAVVPFQESMRLEPAYSADALAELGAIRALAGDRDGARALLEEALRHDPGHRVAREYLDELRSAEDAPRSE